MIVGIKGKLVSSTPLKAIVETCGIFYEINIPVTTAERLPRKNEEVMLHTLAVYREDSQALYGFTTPEDRDFFKILVEKVSGIGPKIALNMMSGMSVETLKNAIASGDVNVLSKCQGIGKKTAQRLVVELKDIASSSIMTESIAGTIGIQDSPNSNNISDAIAALVALGFKLADADKSVRTVIEKLGENATTETIIKAALSR